LPPYADPKCKMVRSSATVTKYRWSSAVPCPRFSKSPVTCTARTKLFGSARFSTNSTPTLAILIMCSTTVRWSVSSTPAAYSSSGEPGGAIRYGTTYIVLPADAPRIRASSNSCISEAGRQLL
jgi:hypothetical protein